MKRRTVFIKGGISVRCRVFLIESGEKNAFKLMIEKAKSNGYWLVLSTPQLVLSLPEENSLGRPKSIERPKLIE